MVQKLDWNDHLAVEMVEQLLQEGKVIAGTSDTVVGLLAAATREGRISLNQIKQREGMPYLVLIKDTQTAYTLSNAFKRKEMKQLIDEFWPGPLTVVVPALPSVSPYLTSATGTIALRMPGHYGLQKLLDECDILFSTSANTSGKPLPETVEGIAPEIKQKIAAMITDESPIAEQPSTILDCTKEPFIILREGAISRQRLQNYL